MAAKPTSEQPYLARVDALASRFVNGLLRQREKSTGHKSDRPWDSWELDEQFFRALSRWTLENPETSLDRVLQNVQDRLEMFQEFSQSIPESPFPARSLVTALAYLLKLGVTVGRAQKDVQEFSKDVVRWVGLLKSSFESADDDQFTRRAWSDIKHMRELVDKICSWAVERLNDGRWLRIGHGLTIQKEIGEFNERIANARALFQDLSAINMARGLDAIMQKMRKVVSNQQTIIGEIQMLRKTQKRQLDRIINEMEIQKQVAERERFFARTLDVHAIPAPTYDNQGKRPCDSDTRVEILDEIRKWRNDIKRGSPNFLWLTGDPGCGKSAVTASFARECKDEGILWAQFFINRNNAETTDPRSYFPSIARQLADYSPEVAQAIHHTLVRRRSLADDISADQAAYLFASAICKASELDPDQSVVVVIDGLDETQHDRVEDTAKIFSTIFTALRAHGNVKIFISSRTENEIQKSFILPIFEKHVRRVHLDTADPSSVRDVSHYIRRNLLDLVRQYDLNWDVWPGDERSRALGERASGLFIWGVTAIKFIGEQIELDGTESLSDLLDMLTADVLYDINALYSFILSVRHRNRRSDWDLERFRRIVGAIVFLHEPLCIDDISTLLDLRKQPSSQPVDIIRFVRRFRTILVTGTDAIDGTTIPHIHKSVFEFITSKGVETQFRIDAEHAHLELGLQCLACLGAAGESAAKDRLTTPFRYASRFWLSHLSQVKALGPRAVCADFRRSPSVSTISSLTPLFLEPIWIRYFPVSSQITVHAGIWDAVSGVSICHTDPITCLLFSPDGKHIVSCSDDKTIKVWDATNGEWIRTLVRSSSRFKSIALSSDGKSIVSGSADGLVRLWDYSTGAPIGRPFAGHTKGVTCVAFSPDCVWLISGSHDRTCILWNVGTGQAVGEPWTGHNFVLQSATISTSCQRACSIDHKGLCIVWDISTGRKVRSWQYGGDSSHPKCISFAPNDDDIIAVGGLDGLEIRYHDVHWWISGSMDTRWLSFSLDGKEISFCTSSSISVAPVAFEGLRAAHLIRRGNCPRSDLVFSSAFSPNFGYFVHADRACVVDVFALQHDKASLGVIPVEAGRYVTLDPKARGGEELVDTLSHMKETQRIHNAIQRTNRRLDEVAWYEADSYGVARSVCMLKDDVVIAGYDDGSVSVLYLDAEKRVQPYSALQEANFL